MHLEATNSRHLETTNSKHIYNQKYLQFPNAAYLIITSLSVMLGFPVLVSCRAGEARFVYRRD